SSGSPTTIAQRSLKWFTPYRAKALAIALIVMLAGVVVAFFGYRARTRTQSATPASIAILPFRTIGNTGQTEMLRLGMADPLIIMLSQLNKTMVLPTSSVSRYTNREKDAVAIGQDLGVEAVLDGTVQRDGDQVRITAQLIRLADKKPIWTAKFDQDYRDLF